MSKGKYVVPVVLGKPARELYFVKGALPRDHKFGFARLVGRRALLEADKTGMKDLPEIKSHDYQYPSFVTELEVVKDTQDLKLSTRQVLRGFVNNTLTSKTAFKELNDWFLLERNGELTPLALAKFSINLLDRDQKLDLLRVIR